MERPTTEDGKPKFTAKKRPDSSRKPGLVHAPCRVEIEAVKKAHKALCFVCDELPTDRRLVVVEGAGRSAKKLIFCITHGDAWLRGQAKLYRRAITYLRSGKGCVRGE